MLQQNEEGKTIHMRENFTNNHFIITKSLELNEQRVMQGRCQ